MTDQLTQQQLRALDALDSIYFDPVVHEEREVLREYILHSTPTRDGWQLVPVEPTQQMQDACDDTPGPMTAWKAWQVMIAAAPTPEDSHESYSLPSTE